MSENTPAPSGSVLGATLLPSLIRTVVPTVYAMLIRWGVVSWLDPDDLFVTNLITILVTAVFYAGIRFLEAHKAQFGWLLGFPQQPVYVKGEVTAVTDQPVAEGAVAAVEHTEPNDSASPGPQD